VLQLATVAVEFLGELVDGQKEQAIALTCLRVGPGSFISIHCTLRLLQQL